MPDLLESMRHRGHDIHCYRQDCYWLDIGRHDDYATANEIFEARRGAFLGTPADQETHDRARPVNDDLHRQFAGTLGAGGRWPPTWSGRSRSAT